MGFADRDYARSHRPSSAIPGLPVISVNTWIIIINVAVFVLGATVFRQPIYYEIGAPLRRQGVTDAQWVSRQILTGITNPGSEPGRGSHPIVTDLDANGRRVVNVLDGRPVPLYIGEQRLAAGTILDAWGHFSTGKALAGAHLWRFITFQFLHASPVHLAFNMFGLWFVGSIVEEYLGRRRYGAFYLTCGAMGAMSYLLLNLLGYYALQWFPDSARHIPFLLVSDVYTPLVGASAGVFGVLMAAAFIVPNTIVEVMFIVPMRMKTAVYLFLGLAVLNLATRGSNAGGDAAHVGGAIAGYWLIRRTHALRDILATFGLGERSRHDRPRPHGALAWPDAAPGMFRPSQQQLELAEVERILDKVSREGLQSLTEAERLTMRESGTRRNAL
jgi:membrane associated rhomboid family serine protease